VDEMVLGAKTLQQVLKQSGDRRLNCLTRPPGCDLIEADLGKTPKA